MKLLLIGISVFLCLPNFLSLPGQKIPLYDHKEKYDPQLAYINSVDKLIFIADSISASKNIRQGTFQYALILNNIISNRFYHGFSHLTLHKNWIAAAGEYGFGHNLSCIVNADDILKFEYAGCSQQSIVLIEAIKRKNISYRSVGFPHHYALELNFDGKWFYFDPNMEPVISDSERFHTAVISSSDSLKPFYDRKHYPDLDWKFGKGQVALGAVNENVAPHAKLFHATSFYFSKLFWLFPLAIAFYPRKRGRQFKKY